MSKIREYAGTFWDICRHRYSTFVFRLVVGITFIVSGAGKLPERSVFVDEVAEYDLLPDALAQVYGTALPLVEIIIGSLLVIGLVARIAAGLGLLTALSLVIANSVVLYRGINMECGCFGDLAELQTRDAIIIDVLLLIFSFLIIVKKGNFLSLDSIVFRKGSSATGNSRGEE